MFIKIKNTPNHSNEPESFTIIDNVKVINHFSPQPQSATSKEDIDKLWEFILNHDGAVSSMDYIYGVMRGHEGFVPPTEDNPYRYNAINFNRYDTEGDEDEQWYFDTVAYIMSDDGKTIEKAVGGGLYSEAIQSY